MKKFTSWLLLFSFLIPSTPARPALTASDKAPSMALSGNLLANPGFEFGKSGWTASGGTYTTTISAANVKFGNAAGDWDSSAAAQTLIATYTFTNGGGPTQRNLAGGCFFKCASGTCTHTVTIDDGTNDLVTAQTITSSTTGFVLSGVNAVAGTGGTVRLKIKSVASNEPELFIDGCYLGDAEGFNIFATQVASNPTIQKFTSGTAATYTTPTGVSWIRVKMVGAGGGGGGSGTTSGTASTSGGNSTWVGSATNTAGGGTGGVRGGVVGDGGTGGTATLNLGSGTALSGTSGSTAGNMGAAPTSSEVGGSGGSSCLGGGGGGGSGSGFVASTNTGGGGGGAGAGTVANSAAGTGGGSGACLDFLISSPSATYTYTVGLHGNGQAAGASGNAGANGADGYIEVTEYYTPSFIQLFQKTNPLLPTVQKFTSGTAQTYTTPTGVSWIQVQMVGAGGGGAGSGTATQTSGTTGGNTTFGTSLLTANGGQGGQTGTGFGGTGGTATVSAPAIQRIALTGGAGGPAQNSIATDAAPGANGAASPFGGQGGGAYQSGVGVSAIANSGSGGGGGGMGLTAGGITGSGGGAGGYVEAVIPSPSPTYTYSVGTIGTHGNAGTSGQNGGDGGTGYIVVTEYYGAFPAPLVINGVTNPLNTTGSTSINSTIPSLFFEGLSNGNEGSGTTTLTVSSNPRQITNLTAARTYTLPTTGVPAGYPITVTNTGDFALTINASGGATVAVLNVGTVSLISNIASPTVKADWIVDRFISKTSVATTFTFNGTGSPGTSGSVTMVLQRNMNMVEVYIPGATATSGTSSTQFTSNTAVPTAFFPTVQQTIPYSDVRNNGGAVGDVGMVFARSDGTFRLFRNSGGTAWTNASSCGFQDDFVGTYYSAL